MLVYMLILTHKNAYDVDINVNIDVDIHDIIAYAII